MMFLYIVLKSPIFFILSLFIFPFLCIVEANEIPVIVWWTELLYPHLENREDIKCPSGKCIVTREKIFNNQTKDITFLFYGTDFQADNLPLPRESPHIWALFHEESPMNNYLFSHQSGIELFNFTATFSRESDFPLTTQFIPSIEYFSERKPVSLNIKNSLRKEGFAPVLYLQSHCNVASDRDSYVAELMKYIPIDSYGLCLQNKKLPLEISNTDTYNDEKLFKFISKYKFHLAFENALCDDYITEKLFRALYLGSVPIYKGSSTIKDWAPSNKSIIVVDDFATPSDLANFIVELDQNDELYNEHLKFKEPGGITNKFLINTLAERTWGVNDMYQIDFIQGFECYICDQMNDLRNVKHKFRPKVATKKHMNCPQPQPSNLDSQLGGNDKWLQANWIETFWYTYDEAQAIHSMIANKETNSSNIFHYLYKYRYF